MIKKAILAILIVLVLSIALSALIQFYKNKPLSIVKNLNLQNRILTENKLLVFRVIFMNFLPLGKAEIENKGIEVYKDKEVYHLSATATVLESISKWFNASAQADSYIDKDKLHSLRFTQSLIIPDKPKDEKEVLYDQNNNIMDLRGVKRQILPDTQDPLSAMFYIQRQPLELGKGFDININTNQKNYRLYAKVIKREEYAINDKKIGVWVIQGDIRRRDKNPYHRTTMTLWLLDNKSKTPILVKVMTSGVLITARLIEVK